MKKDNFIQSNLVAVYFLIPLIAPIGMYVFYNPESRMSLFNLIGFLLVIFSSLLLRRKPDLIIFQNKIVLASIFLILVSGISMFWATYPFRAYMELIPWVCGFMVAPYFISILNIRSNLLYALSVALFSWMILSIIGLLQYFAGWEIVAQAAPPSSTFVNRNLASQYMVFFPCLSPFSCICHSSVNT